MQAKTSFTSEDHPTVSRSLGESETTEDSKGALMLSSKKRVQTKRSVPEDGFQKVRINGEKRKPEGIDCHEGKWTSGEHTRFLEALELYGNCWKAVENYIGTRSCGQIRSHAQKHFKKLRNRTYQELKRANKLHNMVFIVTREYYCYQGPVPSLPTATLSSAASFSDSGSSTPPNEDDAEHLIEPFPLTPPSNLPLSTEALPSTSEESWVANLERENAHVPAQWESQLFPEPILPEDRRQEELNLEDAFQEAAMMGPGFSLGAEECEQAPLRRVRYEL